jgi:hypothetical protein
MSLQRFMPRWRLRQVDHVAVTADPERAYRAARGVDLYRLAIARSLFGLRLVPERLIAWARGREVPRTPAATIDQFTAPGNGFHLLEDGEREVVVGAIGKVWRPSIEFADFTPDAFLGHDDRGWVMVAWSLAVSPRDGGSWITFDVRVDAGDEASWAKFSCYWRLIGPFSHAIRHGLLRSFARELGPAASDTARVLVGDELLPEARAQLTHAIDIEAPPARVWPWLAQMGGQRAGWYSWDRLDHGGKPSADRIVPALQHLAVGDVIAAAPEGDGGFDVLRVDPGHALILGASTSRYEGTWTFALEPIGADATHLVTRYRAAYAPDLRMRFLRPAMSRVHALMERKQLRTIKHRAEAS